MPTELPTTEQIIDLNKKLHERFPNGYCSIEIHTMSYASPEPGIELPIICYWFSVENIYSEYLSTWAEVLEKYKELTGKDYE